MQSTIDLNANRMARVQLGESANLNIKVAPPVQSFNAFPPQNQNFNIIPPQPNKTNGFTNSMTGSEPALCMHISSSSQLNFRLLDPPPSLTASTERQLHQIAEESTHNNNNQNQQTQPQPVTVNVGGTTESSNNVSSEIRTTTNIRLGYDEPVYATVNRKTSSASVKSSTHMSTSSYNSEPGKTSPISNG